MRQKVNIITLGVKNLEKSKDFYHNKLGWDISSASNENIVFIPMGGVILALFPKNNLAEDAQINSNGNGFSGFTLSHNTKTEKEVDEVLTQVEKLGGTLIKEAEKVFWGGYSGYFADPDGYLWEVAYNPYLEFDSNDNLILP